MFKFVVFALVVCVANAGLIGAGIGHGALVAAPIAVAHTHLASSYQNNNQISLHPTAVVATHAVAHAPIAIGIGHGFGLGGQGSGYGQGLGYGLGHGHGGLLH